MIYAITLILLVLSASVDEPAGARPDPYLAALFVPARSHLGRYEVCTTAASPAASFSQGFSTGDPERLEALEAFGTAGSYDRARLAQLYGGRRIEVVRGWRAREGRFESMTALSPYPDPSFSRINPGTLLVRWTIGGDLRPCDGTPEVSVSRR
jgi:hypothetical protein